MDEFCSFFVKMKISVFIYYLLCSVYFMCFIKITTFLSVSVKH